MDHQGLNSSTKQPPLLHSYNLRSGYDFRATVYVRSPGMINNPRNLRKKLVNSILLV